MNKERIKGIAIGFILCAMLSVSVIATANTQTVTRQITYGVRVNLNGQVLQFADDNQPFVMEGRTFLPVRALADALDLPVDFDPATNMVYLGNRHLGHRTPLRQVAPFFERSPNNNANVAFNDSNEMGGITYRNTLAFARNFGGLNSAGGTNFTLHNLNGQFRMLSGYMGRVDGSALAGVTISFYGDGNLLRTYTLNATDMPTEFNVFVEGIRQLRISVEFPNHIEWTGTGRIWYAIAAYLE